MKINQLILLAVLLLFNFNNTYAYFQTKEHSGSLHLNSIKENQDIEDDLEYYLYDNHITSDNDFYLSKQISGYIPLGKLDVEFPLIIRMGNQLYLEKNIDRISLIALKIQHLLSEYAELRERAAAVVRNAQMDPQVDPENYENYNKEFIIQAKKDELLKKFQDVNQLSRQPLIGKTDSLDLDSLVSSETPFEYYPLMQSDNSAVMQTGEPDRSEQYSQKRRGGRRVNIEELPWFFKVVLKVLNVLNNNKIEVVVCLFILVIGIIVVVSLTKR